MDDDYHRYHRDRRNLAIHVVAVPAFVATLLLAVAHLLMRQWAVAALWLLGPILAMALQAIGHRCESVPPEPFSGPGNFLFRILKEQCITFPRWLASGGWLAAWRASGTPPA